MIIEIREIPNGQKLSRITVDFDNGEPHISTQTVRKSKKGESKGDTKDTEEGTAIDFSTLGDLQVSQEVVEKPKIPDTGDRSIKVVESMQNLQI